MTRTQKKTQKGPLGAPLDRFLSPFAGRHIGKAIIACQSMWEHAKLFKKNQRHENIDSLLIIILITPHTTALQSTSARSGADPKELTAQGPAKGNNQDRGEERVKGIRNFPEPATVPMHTTGSGQQKERSLT